MKRSEAARYARWSAAVASLLAVITAGVYVQRGWKARKERKNAPAAAAANVSRQSNGLTFSKVEGNRKTFTVEASKSTDFKDRDLTELEVVVITIFGKNGDRHDVIHTQSCQYGKTDGNVVCSGAVRMDLESAADFERASSANAGAAPQIMHVETKAVTFNRANGTAATAEPVSFDFPNGSGEGVGMEYRSEAGAVKLLKDVRLKLRPPANTAASGNGKAKTRAKTVSSGAASNAANPNTSGSSSSAPDREVTVTGSSLDFDRISRKMHVTGPAVAETKTTRLTASELTMDMDAQFRAQTLLASGEVNGQQPKMVSHGREGQTEVNGDKLTAEFAPEGWVTTVLAEGNVTGARFADVERDDASSQSATIAMWPRVNEVKELNLRGDVVLKTLVSASGDSRVLHTNALRMEFSGGQPDEPSRPLTAETLSAGRMEWTETNATSLSAGAPGKNAATVKNKSGVGSAAGNPPTPAHTTLAADKLRMQFDALGKPKQLLADGHVQTERTMTGKPTQTATAQNGAAQLLPAGGWSQMDLNGGVKLREADRNGQGDHAMFRREEQTATLTGHAFARDATTETSAPRIVFVQNTGDIHAEGGVRSTDFSAQTSAVQLAPAPTHITAETLQGNSQTGRALYTGHARMWQGESVLEADSIELLRETRVMNALGNIRAVFPQEAATTSGAPNQGAASVVTAVASTAPTPVAKSATGQTTAPGAAKKSTLWHVTAQSLVYNDLKSHAHLEHDVIAVSADQKMRAPVVDLDFTRGTSIGTPANASGGNSGTPAATSGPQQISRAVGTGGTTVEENGRKAVAERGVYTASDGKFVMSGGTPTLYDSTEGTTVGRQLTFFLADDTIIVDSENGPRVLTRHRVEN
jgi:lipopolysaccharide export system protein LptA